MKMLFKETSLEFDELNDPLFTEKKVSVIMARLDKIHPVISGNKLFKLHYFLEESIRQNRKAILSFGGAYSNHLVATAYACKSAGINCIGIVRGERPVSVSHTLQQCETYGMQLHYISRETYHSKDSDKFIEQLTRQFGECILIPEGGYHPLGAAGASLIMNNISGKNATHVCTAVGTATTLAGLLMNRINNEKIIGVPVLKNMTDIAERLSFLHCKEQLTNLAIFDEYHFGGYAKRTTGLISFMNDLFLKHTLPTDFIYTAKMMYAVIDKIKAGYFTEGSTIICLHTGGLQGNASLPAGTLVF